MTLDEWLKLAKQTLGMNETQFGAAVGISQSQVNRLRRGKSWPTKERMIRIREVTNKKVTPDDWTNGVSA